MPAFAKASLSLLALAMLEVACRGTLPPTEPPRSNEASPGTRTNDTPVANPLAVDPLTATGGSSALPSPPGPSGGTSPTP